MKWPNVLGVIAIVFGVGGVLLNAWGIIGTFLLSSGLGMPTPAGFTAQIDRLQRWNVGAAAAGLVLAILLLCCGVGLTTRRRWSVTGFRVWSVLRICAVLVPVIANYSLQKTVLRASMPASSGTVPLGTGLVGVTILISLVFALAWAWALPVFALIWFSRPKIKAETQTWE